VFNSKFIFTDIHGNYLTLRSLIKEVATKNNINEAKVINNMVICGDLQDRGPRSKQVIQFCIDNKIPVIMGNHELMMIDSGLAAMSRYIKDSVFGDDIWTLNGGDKTMESYISIEKDEDGNDFRALDHETFLQHIEWMKTLPLYLEYKDIRNKFDRYLVCSHSQIHNTWKSRNAPKIYRELKDEFDRIMDSMDIKERAAFKKLDSFKHLKSNINTAKIAANRFEEQVCWGRPSQIRDSGDIYNVHGHTPQANGPHIKSIYACIDTGCFYKRDAGYYRLTCLQFPEMGVTIQENIDEVDNVL